MKQKFAVFL